jgi:hypothetical protein
MSTRVLLISSNRCDQPYPVFPLGLAHVDSALSRAGHVTRVLIVRPREPIEDNLVEFRPDVVGVSLRNIDDVEFVTRQTYFGDAVAISAMTIRQMCPCPMVLGGSAFSIFPEQLLAIDGCGLRRPRCG